MMNTLTQILNSEISLSTAVSLWNEMMKHNSSFSISHNPYFVYFIEDNTIKGFISLKGEFCQYIPKSMLSYASLLDDLDAMNIIPAGYSPVG